jgi:hypothetical protein
MNSYYQLLYGKKGLISRYFRRNEGTTDYATTSDITMDADVVIEFDINAPPQDDNNAVSFRNVSALNTFGVASGRDIADNAKMRIFSNAVPVVDTATSMDVFDNIFHKVRVEYTLATTSVRVLIDGVEGIAPTTLGYDFSQTDILTVWRDVTTGDEMAGIIANLEISDAGTLIHKWAINSNSGTETDTVGGAVLTYVNGTADQWGLFQKQATGEWLGQNTAVNGNLANGTTGYDTSNATLAVVGGRLEVTGTQNTSRATQPVDMVAGGNYEFRGQAFPGTSGSQTAVLFSSGFTENASQSNINGNFLVTLTPTVTGQGQFWLRSDIGTAYFDNISIKEVLNVA